MDYQAIEDFRLIRDAVQLWKNKFKKGAERFEAMGGEVFWQSEIGIWAHFSKNWRPQKKSGHYWNPFGRVPHSFRQNMTVEINPPMQGINTNVQGIIAKDTNGSRWILHQGRLHPRQVRITEEMFDKATNRKRVSVRFSDGSIIEYHPIANLDLSAFEVQRQCGAFVVECERARQHYLFGPEVASEDGRITLAEGMHSPERFGRYKVGPQPERIVTKWHARIWEALVERLDAKHIPHTNGRVGMYGPDLRTAGKRRVLFEIKSDGTSSDLQRAVGQLLLYEKLLGKKYIKVIVLPEPPNAAITKAIDALGLASLIYLKKGRSISFDKNRLAALVDG
jgi:hypothetical protein